MAYEVPEDLPEKPMVYSRLGYMERQAILAELAQNDPYISPVCRIEHVYAALCITMNEQPGSVPVNNCAGIMCQGKTRHWGWKWPVGVPEPVGFAFAREGQTANERAPFLAFASAHDSLKFLLAKVIKRDIRTAEGYADQWVGDDSQRAGAISGFNHWLGVVSGKSIIPSGA
jgi:hypothetical protein